MSAGGNDSRAGEERIGGHREGVEAAATCQTTSNTGRVRLQEDGMGVPPWSRLLNYGSPRPGVAGRNLGWHMAGSLSASPALEAAEPLVVSAVWCLRLKVGSTGGYAERSTAGRTLFTSGFSLPSGSLPSLPFRSLP